MSDDNPVVNAVKKLKQKFGDKLLIAVDICLCPYSTSGHCGVFDQNGEIDILKSISILADMAVKMAKGTFINHVDRFFGIFTPTFFMVTFTK